MSESAVARANVRGWHGCSGYRWGHFGAIGHVAHELNLEQCAEGADSFDVASRTSCRIRAASGILCGDRRNGSSRRANGNSDESKVQEIATRQGVTLLKLLLEKEHFKTKIYASVLDPEQRTKADKLQSQWHERLDNIGKGME